MRLTDRAGNLLAEPESDNEASSQQVVNAINRAIVSAHDGRDLSAAPTSSISQMAKEQGDKEYYSNPSAQVRVTDLLLTLQSNSWQINQLRPVQLERKESNGRTKFYMRLTDKAGNLLTESVGDNETGAQQVVTAINKAIADSSPT